MLLSRFSAGRLRVQAKATDTASSQPSPSAAGGAAAKRSRAQDKTAGAAAAEKPRRKRVRNPSRGTKAWPGLPQQRPVRQYLQQSEQPELSQHLDKLVLAPFQGCKGDLTFNGELRYAHTYKEARVWLGELLQLADGCSSSSPLVVGVDTETAVKWGQRQQDTPTSLLQLCYHAAGSSKPVCLLLALHTLGMLSSVQRVLQHPSILKVGIGIAHDMMDLLRSHQVDNGQVRGMVDLHWLAMQCRVLKDSSPQDAARQQEMHAAGITTFQPPLQWGLAGLLQRTSEFSLLKIKRITMSDWSRFRLSEQQLQYAACDAYAGLLAFHALWLVWLQQQPPQQQPVAVAASTPPGSQQVADGSSSSSSSSSSMQGSFGSPATTAAEFEGLLDWLMDDDQQQQAELQPAVTMVMPSEPQPAPSSSTSSSSSSSTTAATHGVVVAAAASADPLSNTTDLTQSDSAEGPHMPFTIQKRYLTDAGFWRSYAPAAHRQHQWHRLLQRGTTAAQLQYNNMIANALDKAVAEDGSDFDRAAPGTPVVDAGADAAAAGMFWP